MYPASHDRHDLARELSVLVTFLILRTVSESACPILFFDCTPDRKGYQTQSKTLQRFRMVPKKVPGATLRGSWATEWPEIVNRTQNPACRGDSPPAKETDCRVQHSNRLCAACFAVKMVDRLKRAFNCGTAPGEPSEEYSGLVHETSRLTAAVSGFSQGRRFPA